MNIGDAARKSGLPTKTIRYYEDRKLIAPTRRENGYRDYSIQDVHKLAFLHRARSLGFPLETCRQLLSLYEDQGRASADVKQLANGHLREIDSKIAEMKDLRDTLHALVKACHGDQRPDCPILNGLSGTERDE